MISVNLNRDTVILALASGQQRWVPLTYAFKAVCSGGSDNIDNTQPTRVQAPTWPVQEIMVSENFVHYKQKAPYQDDTIEPLLEPSNGILLLYSVLETDTGRLGPPLSHTSSWSSHHDVKVHPKDTNTGVISSTEIDVFLDTESKISSLREVPLSKLVLLDFEPTLEDFLGLGATDGDVDGDLFVTTDTECSDGVSSFRCDGCLAGELFQYLGGSGQPVTRFPDGDVCTTTKFRYSSGNKAVNALITSFSIRSSFIGFVGTDFCSACMLGKYKGGGETGKWG